MPDETSEFEPIETAASDDPEAAAQPATYQPIRHSSWDFSELQRIVIAVLLWLNIIMLTTGYLALTGQVSL